MSISIRPTENGLKIESRLPVDTSFINKINNPVNSDRINNHLKDMRCQHYTRNDKDGPISVLYKETYEVMSEEELQTCLQVMKANHDSFIENVTQRMVEVQPANVSEDEEKLKSAIELLEDLEENHKNDNDIILAVTVGPFAAGFAHLNTEFLKEIISCYIKCSEDASKDL